MKKLIITSTILAALVFAGCKKTRTCSCTTNSTNTTVRTPRDGSPAQTESSTSTSNDEQTFAKVKKNDMKRIFDCNDRTVTSSNTYTSAVFTGTGIVTVDVKSTSTDEMTCKIK